MHACVGEHLGCFRSLHFLHFLASSPFLSPSVPISIFIVTGAAVSFGSDCITSEILTRKWNVCHQLSWESYFIPPIGRTNSQSLHKSETSEGLFVSTPKGNRTSKVLILGSGGCSEGFFPCFPDTVKTSSSSHRGAFTFLPRWKCSSSPSLLWDPAVFVLNLVLLLCREVKRLARPSSLQGRGWQGSWCCVPSSLAGRNPASSWDKRQQWLVTWLSLFKAPPHLLW